ncbi:cytochrome c oxidase assembly protein [Sphingomonas faeni]|uniref:cytochrome c oxidase assembly protein n=1 Tax=Sphingomonas faeni TaxID=185950 RepID=UPI0027D7C4F6|nr:cytochrome c oxidase assembly protein [Sphingomonas faeni]
MALPLVLLGLLTLLYVGGVVYQTRVARRGWSRWRTAAWGAGAAVLALGLMPQYLPFPAGDFRQHMLQHMLLGMLAPLGLVMAAPITLTLRTAPAPFGRAIVRVLRWRPIRLWANPVTALVLNLGGMAGLYFTPLYMAMMTHAVLHYLVHFHFVAAGCLYVWVIAGPDPAPHRLSVPARLVVLGAAVVIHAIMAQMLYAGWFVTIPVPPHQLRRGAELMYYGGDITEMLLALAMVSSWRPRGRRFS